MKKFAVFPALLMLLLIPSAARAQKIQLFGGYSYLRQDTGAGKVNLNGWEASATLIRTGRIRVHSAVLSPLNKDGRISAATTPITRTGLLPI